MVQEHQVYGITYKTPELPAKSKIHSVKSGVQKFRRIEIPEMFNDLEFDDDGDVVPVTLATKSGIKYEDVNFSGDYEPGTDTLLENWTIYAYRDIGTTPGELDAGDRLVASTLTAASE